MRQLSLDLPEAAPLTDLDRLHNRLANGSVQPESRNWDDQHELFAIHSRIAEEEGHFGHLINYGQSAD